MKVFLVLVMICISVYALPKQVQIDIIKTKMIKQQESGDYEGLLSNIGKWRSLDENAPSSLLYWEAKSYYELKDFYNAFLKTQSYIEKVGTKGRYYSDVLSIYVEVEPSFEKLKKEKEELALKLNQIKLEKDKPFVYSAKDIYRGKREFRYNTDNTVKELRGLIWQTGFSQNKMSWSNAKSYCSNLVLDGYNDWRLPTSNELYYLADRTKHKPAIDTNYFQESGNWYWSSTSYKNGSSRAWGVNFNDGNGNYDSKSSKDYVRCVRGRQ
jgi:hypothetical protein